MSINKKLNIAISIILITAIIIGITMSIITNVYACFNPADLNAIEVLFNKPGVDYNITVLLTRFSPIAIVDSSGPYVFKYIYRLASGENLVFGVTLYIERFCGSTPCIEDYNEDKPIAYILGLRMELLEPEVCTTQTTPKYSEVETSVTKGGCIQKSAINLAFSELLTILVSKGVILGLDQKDIYMIIDAVASSPIAAGWNNRLMYNDVYGGWASYSDLIYRGVVKGVLIKTIGCSYTLPQAILEDIKSFKPALTIAQQKYNLETPYQQYQNGLATTIAIAIGVSVALVVYIIWRTLYKI